MARPPVTLVRQFDTHRLLPSRYLPGGDSVLAAIADDDWVSVGRKNNEAGLVQLSNGAEKLGLATVPSRANFLLIDTGRPCLKMFDALLRRGVIVRAFGSLPTMLRVTVGTPAQNERFLAALADSLKEVAL